MLAWATTIHKSQGQTYNSVVIDLGTGAFASGQTYVALSRCRTLDKIYLVKPIKKSDIKIDLGIKRYLSQNDIIRLSEYSTNLNYNENGCGLDE